jgi:hypothetical protein
MGGWRREQQPVKIDEDEGKIVLATVRGDFCRPIFEAPKGL